ncbi:uncharacterized protein LOC125221161 [Salvia hispanica]|uniref:uncharacterized protein LOC125221161 n=1 Tax=Salvia hispanica TaxID=49212 RepID=UPI0020093B3C|nr:uncharacterized protein LOC125221161 [Salvia hispanica]
MMSSSRDNWERLVKAVIKRDEIWQLCHQDSISTIASDTPRTSYSSGDFLRIPSDLFKRILASRPPQPPLEARGPSTRKLFPAWLWRRKPKDYDRSQEDHFGLKILLRELLDAIDSFRISLFVVDVGKFIKVN